MHTKDKLAAALKEVGLVEMSTKAATGYYHDYLSPLDLPEMQLDHDLHQALKQDGANVEEIKKLIGRHHNGDFDANTEESEEWARSPEGQAAFASLVMPRKS